MHTDAQLPGVSQFPFHRAVQPAVVSTIGLCLRWLLGSCRLLGQTASHHSLCTGGKLMNGGNDVRTKLECLKRMAEIGYFDISLSTTGESLRGYYCCQNSGMCIVFKTLASNKVEVSGKPH